MISAIYDTGVRWLGREGFFVAVGVVTTVALQAMKSAVSPRWGESHTQMMGRWMKKIPQIKAQYNAEIQKNRTKFEQEWSEKYSHFPNSIDQIPVKGLSKEKAFHLIRELAEMTNNALVGKDLSGTVYPAAFKANERVEGFISESPRDKGWESLQDIFLEAFKRGNLWNSLHMDEFTVGPWIKRQVVRMVADMFGGCKETVSGTVTTGGTESLMYSARAYRNWGMETKGVAPGDAVIIAPRSIHAALNKASEDYQIRLVLVDIDGEGRPDYTQMKALMKKHQRNLVAVYASAPSYATGVVDDIKRVAGFADEIGCGMHVDCCLGGFIVNFLPHCNFLQFPGVTSLSCDTHKNGQGVKGSSALVTKDLGDQNLIHYGIYSVPHSDIGVYGSVNSAGSDSCVAAFCAYLAMLTIGKEGYKEIARSIHESAKEIAKIIKSDERLELITEPEVNVVAFRMKFREGSSYVLVDEMKKNGVILNAIKDNRAHFCVTHRFASDTEALGRFKKALQKSLDGTMKRVESNEVFSRTAATYFELSQAEKPDSSKLGLSKWVENQLFGQEGAKDAVKLFFEASL